MTEIKIEETNELMWQSLDANGQVLAVNDLWLEKMGYTRDEVIGRKFSDFVTPQCHPKVQDEFPHLKNYGFVNNVLLELQRKDGVVIEGVLNGTSSYEGTEFVKTSCELKTIDYFVDSVAQAKKMLARERLASNISYLKLEIANGLFSENEYERFVIKLYEILCEPVEISEVHLLNSTGDPLPQVSADASPLEPIVVTPIVESLIEKHKISGASIFALTESETSALAKAKQPHGDMLDRQSATQAVPSEDVTLCAIISNPFGEDDYLAIMLNISGFATEQKMWQEAVEMISLLVSKGLRSLHHVKEQEKTLEQLKRSLDEIKTLKGIIPICMYCKEIRDDKGSWNQLEKYIIDHSDAMFSHGICDDCLEKHEQKMREKGPLR